MLRIGFPTPTLPATAPRRGLVLKTSRVTILAALCVASMAGRATATPFAYVAHSAGMGTAAADVIDLQNDTMVATVPIGSGEANGIAVNPSGTRVYAAVGLGVKVIDTSTNTVVATVDVGGCTPYGVALNPTGTRLYVTTRLSNFEGFR